MYLGNIVLRNLRMGRLPLRVRHISENREENMKSKSYKVLLWGLIIGLVGMAVTIGITIATDKLMSRETEAVFEVGEAFESVALDTGAAEVSFVPTDAEYRVEAYIKAWRPEPIDLDEIVSVAVNDGVLTITETPFPSDFFGVFPQPYELKLTVYAPEGVAAGGNQ